MGRRVTIIDIARAAGVSKSTVSLVLTDGAKVKAETAQRVRAAMQEFGYIYHRGAADLRSPRSRIVGMVINDLSNPFFAELAIGIERVLRAAGHIPFLANTAESVLRQTEVVRSMREHGAAGVILCPTADTDAAQLESLATLGMPIVLAIRRVTGSKLSLVASDNRGGSLAAVRHLLGLGHQRIAFIGGVPSMGVREDRFGGYAAALEEASLTVDPALVVESLPTKEGGFDATAVLLQRERPTALFCFNDVTAIGAMLAATRAGLTPGVDLAVVGFDDTSEARHMSPALTSVRVGVGDLGERAAQTLLRQIAGGPAETHIGEALLVTRASSGKPITTKTNNSRRVA